MLDILDLKKDIDLAKTLTDYEARFLVDLYYQVQDFRIQSGNALSASTNSEEPNLFLQTLGV